jgi:hypothetical protein
MRTNFYEGLSDNGYLSCPNCKNDYVDDSEFSDDCLSIKCTCFGCGKEYTVDLTYDAIVKKAEQMAEEVRARREQMLKGVTT